MREGGCGVNWPADGTMLALLAHEAGDTFIVVGGELHLTVKSDGQVMPAPVAALVELERRGWIEVLPSEDGGTAITPTGRYWLNKWLVTRLGKGRIRRVNNLRVTRELV